jgi:hypothetical protein
MIMKTLTIILSFFIFSACLMAAHAQSVYTLYTSAGEFDSGVLNQGWWSDFGGNNTYNDNYSISLSWTADSYPYPQGIIIRDFFTFDLSAISGTIQSATLLLTQGNSGSPNPTEMISFWDVQTPTAVLNNNTGSDASIVNDLGSGNNFGSFQVSMVGPTSQVLAFNLNASAIAALNADKGSDFSIGGSMDGQPASGVYRYIFGVNQGIPAELQLTVVPEPTAADFIVLTVICIWMIRSRRYAQVA